MALGKEKQPSTRSVTESGAQSGTEASTPKIVLASGSPRRFELLKDLGLKFCVKPSQFKEPLPNGLNPEQFVQSLALEKAEDVFVTLDSSQELVVIGADTMVALDEELIGKPADRAEAEAILSRLSGKSHCVYTGVAVLHGKNGKKRIFKIVEKSLVTFRKLSASEIHAYALSSEPFDKAGAYALQGVASAFVEKVEGCYTNIIGLPIPKVVSILREIGINILGSAVCQDTSMK
jgi:septum formation protein